MNENINFIQKLARYTNINSGESCFTYKRCTGVEVNRCEKY